jgi:hypothetical protein
VPAFAYALEGRRSDGARPAGGRRLSRITSGPGMTAPIAVVPAQPPTGSWIADDVRRTTGSYTGVSR